VTDWIIVGVLYALGMAFFRMLGGIAAAGEAFRRWGRASAGRRSAAGSSS
jgi:hypothetical protein